MYKSVKKSKRNFELVLEQIQFLIISGALKPGDRLMPERELAEQLNVSRTSIREALRILEALDIVWVKPGEGTVIKKPTLQGFISPMALFLQEDSESHSNLFETRMLLEAGIARLAATRRGDGDLQQMARYCGLIQDSTDLEEVIQADIGFHTIIFQAAKNPTLTSFARLVGELMKHGIRKTREALFYEEGENEISSEQHWVIYQAILKRDPDAAYQAMYRHIEYTAEKSILFRQLSKRRY
ncbi:FadR/GntR family transcriptional regulator [Ammoniphilus sp. 3BR4]|uniref:FadR/GntR family transcriptional regulator n=1 Tax=Ammoniphilus sp. 3BR4 TaxID=3158265 RepID=UPI003467165F